MSGGLMKHGRKWLALAINVGAVVLILGMSFYLAVTGKLSPEWSALCQILIGALTAAVSVFMGTNAAITRKAIEEGVETPEEQGSTS